MPVILHSRLSPFSTVHHYSTRQSTGSHFLLPLCRTNFGQKMVLYRAMVAWNSLPQFLNLGMNTMNFRKRLRLYLFTFE